ncbi:Na+/H+ antiporter NhaC family protein [Butyrivibrio sp. MC2013]|uniref:Na+/H+ antiporter NhaC family protein n=1 Tax=Butyrivibrio sp. MC2013 TaxID=1280686 RepID=UPI0004238D07|nr:Na+/H+ antiporter NhaC family protein [Butyrivibrio sp. MC2013]
MDKRNRYYLVHIVLFCVMVALMAVAAVATNADTVQESFWALVPPLIAIILALISKEVYSSLFLGVVAGALLYSDFNVEAGVNHLYTNGLRAVLSDEYNVGILCFLVILGVMVALMNKAGGSAAFGEWASKHIKSRVGVQLATIALGVLIFIDDYFNCLTVGSVMRPVTDKYKVSRAKLAYLIDATAAPVCIIAPISSWAAAVSGFVEGENGIGLFVKTIPYNFYALLTIIMMVSIVVFKADYGPMARFELEAAEKGDVFGHGKQKEGADSEDDIKGKGTVLDLILPVVALIVCCIFGMIYTGGFFEGESFINAFAGSDASVGLVYGSFAGMILTISWYFIRRVLSFRDCMECIPEGFKSMVPAILILTLAWSLKSMTDSLGAKEYVAALVEHSAGSMLVILPGIIFLVACFLAFATGTSWGTFGILIPIVVTIFSGVDDTMMIISMSACMAGAVCGDHCSPISDTTIMSSAGAKCNHIDHVSTQMPYAMTCAAISFITYLLAGITRSAWISLPVGIILTVGFCILMGSRNKQN